MSRGAKYHTAHLTPEELAERIATVTRMMAENRTMREAGELYGVSREAIRHFCNRYGITRRKYARPPKPPAPPKPERVRGPRRETFADVQRFWQKIRQGRQVLGGGRSAPVQRKPPPRDARTPKALEAHRAKMLHDTLPTSSGYRALLEEACREFDASQQQEKRKRAKSKGRGQTIVVPRRKAA